MNLKSLIFLLTSLIFCSAGCSKEENTPKAPEDDSNQEDDPILPTRDFTIVVMPDTQHYTSGVAGGTNEMFSDQIDWIVHNKEELNIVYVLGVGDITQYGDRKPEDWVRAKNGYYTLDEKNIPYGLAIGNHDQWPQNYPLTGTTDEYNKWFGISHFSDKPYYGGHYGDNNDSHYDLFSAGGQRFIVIFIEYDNTNEDWDNVNTWAYDLLGTYSSRKAIIVTHYLMKPGNPGGFGPQGQAIYDRLKSRDNVFMMLGGHLSGPGQHDGEGYREDVYDGHTIRSYLIDYQGYDKVGKGGYLRSMQFTINANDVRHETYSPYLQHGEKDEDSYFTKPLFGPAPQAVLQDGKYKIITGHSDKVLTVKDASMENNAKVIQDDYSDNEMENDEWLFEEIGNSGWYKIINAYSAKGIVGESASMNWGSKIMQYTYSDNNIYNDEWGLYEIGGGYFKIINRRTGLCLKARGNAGSQCVQSIYQLLDDEKFHIVSID